MGPRVENLALLGAILVIEGASLYAVIFTAHVWSNCDRRDSKRRNVS